MTYLKRTIIFGFLFFITQANSQTLRQLITNSDVICIVQKDSVTSSSHFLGDAFERIERTNNVTVAQWLKPPKGKKIPQEIVYKTVSEPSYPFRSSNCGVGEVIASNEVYYDFLFLKKEKNNYIWLSSYFCTGAKADKVMQAINKVMKISDLKSDAERYAASVDFILGEFILGDPANFLEDGSYTELEPESVLVRYYKQKGIITDATILNESNQLRLMNFIVSQLNEGNCSYVHQNLVPMFYERFAKETDLAIANCLKKITQKAKTPDSEFDENHYDIGMVLSVLYACNKSYGLKDFYYSDEDVSSVTKNLIDEIEKRYAQE